MEELESYLKTLFLQLHMMPLVMKKLYASILNKNATAVLTLVRKKKTAITKQIYIISLGGNSNMKMIMVHSLGEEATMYNDDNREWFCIKGIDG